MTKQDLFGMEIGNYNLSDDIENYFYDLEIGLLDNGERYYKINEKGYFNRGYFFMVEDYEKDEDGVIYKIL